MSTMFLDSQTRLLTLIVVGCKRVCTRWSSLGDQLPKGLGAGAGWFSLIYRLVRLDPYFRKNWHCRCVFNCIVYIIYTYKIHILLVYTISTVCRCTYVYLVRVCMYLAFPSVALGALGLLVGLTLHKCPPALARKHIFFNLGSWLCCSQHWILTKQLRPRKACHGQSLFPRSGDGRAWFWDHGTFGSWESPKQREQSFWAILYIYICI